DSMCGITHELLDAIGKRLGHRFEGKMSLGRIDAVAWHVDVLRRGAHLSGVERERKGDVARDCLDVARRVDDDLIHARLFGVDLRLTRVFLEPFTVGSASGKVDALHLGTPRESLRGIVAWRV